MAVKNLELPVFHYTNPQTSTPASGWLVNVYAADTTTRINTWQDSSQSVLNANPVVLDSYGNAKIWFDQSAKIVVTDASGDGTYGFTFDNISPVGGTTVVTGEYNLAQNGSFESSNTDGTPAQWTLSLLDPSASILTSTADVTHGKQSCLFTGYTGAGCGSATSQQFDVTADSMMALSFDMKASIATTESDVQIFWYQKDGTTAATPASTTVALPADGSSPTSWTTYSFLYAVPSDATRAEIKITGIGAGSTTLDGTVYFDNVMAYDNQSVAVGYTASPVTYLKASAGATGINPSIASEGEANTGMILKDSNGNEMIIAESVASAVNEVTVTNAAAASKPSIDQTGSGDVGIDIEGVELHNGAVTTPSGLVTDSIEAETTQIDSTSRWSISGATAGATFTGTNSTGGAANQAIKGQHTATTGAVIGVYGTIVSTTTGAVGVFGSAGAASGVTYGVRGNSNSASGYDFYATGAGTNYGPFTGGHDGLVDKSFTASIGDIVKDSYILNKKNISNAIAVNELCTIGDTPIGVFTSKHNLSENLPTALVGYVGDLSSFDRISFNAVGEGCINVCGKNGNINSGDLIVCSSIAGKGMRQEDDVVRSITVAKARESVDFNSEEEVKQIACIYLCG